MNKTHTGQSVHYTIRIEGKVDSRWSEWFNGMEIVVEDETHPVTTLSGPVIDQARLRGILNKLWDLNLTLISVDRFERADRRKRS